MFFCWKYSYHSQNSCEVLTQWEFVHLGSTLTYTTSNLNKLRKRIEANQCFDGNRKNYKTRNPWHKLPKTCGGSKSVCLVWIRTTENLKSHPRTSFWMNERWSNKYDTHKSTINKRRLERRTWRRFYIEQRNQLKQISLNTQPEPSPQPSTNLREKQIHLSGLDTSHRQFSIKTKDKFQYKWTLIRSMITDRSTINDAHMITKTPKKYT